MSKKNPYWTNITEQKPNRTVPSSTEEKKKKSHVHQSYLSSINEREDSPRQTNLR